MSIPTSAFPFRRHALALALALATGASSAATINVSGDCTLINAINNANSDTDTDGSVGCAAGSDADTLELEANAIYTLTESFFDAFYGSSGLPMVTSAITINGNGATIARSKTPGTPEFRLLSVNPTGNLTINQLTLTGGYSNYGVGAGISNYSGTLTINNSTISNNSYRMRGLPGGVGISNFYGVLTITGSTISNNEGLDGGGIRQVGGSLTLTNSTVSGNVSWHYGAGIRSYSDANVTLINSTVSGNSGGNGAAGIWSVGHLTLINSTVSSNSSDDNGGPPGLSASGSLTLINSLIANHGSVGDCPAYNPHTVITLQGINLIEDGSCGAPLSGDPKLRALLDNGGPTLTHALRGTSPAIAAGEPTLCETADQRNVKRPRLCDLGAFERKALSPASVKPLVLFFDDQVASGGLNGTIAGKKTDQRVALRNQLLAAGGYRDRNLTTESCDQLARTLGYIDPDNSPEADDYATGTGGGLLTDEINALRSAWSCS